MCRALRGMGCWGHLYPECLQRGNMSYFSKAKQLWVLYRAVFPGQPVLWWPDSSHILQMDFIKTLLLILSLTIRVLSESQFPVSLVPNLCVPLHSCCPLTYFQGSSGGTRLETQLFACCSECTLWRRSILSDFFKYAKSAHYLLINVLKYACAWRI